MKLSEPLTDSETRTILRGVQSGGTLGLFRMGEGEEKYHCVSLLEKMALEYREIKPRVCCDCGHARIYHTDYDETLQRFVDHPCDHWSGCTCPHFVERLAARGTEMKTKTAREHAEHILRVLGFEGEEVAIQAIGLAIYLETYVMRQRPGESEDH